MGTSLALDLNRLQYDSVLVPRLVQKPGLDTVVFERELGRVHHQAVRLTAKAMQVLKEHKGVAEIR